MKLDVFILHSLDKIIDVRFDACIKKNIIMNICHGDQMLSNEHMRVQIWLLQFLGTDIGLNTPKEISGSLL